ncbi:MAG TPA: MacB family efflux pump subunit [Alphaproteobacteria bacterium]|nr:MacB family efflux pump subunit [Alphaproteobacteria bacterium]
MKKALKNTGQPLLLLQHIGRHYQSGDTTIKALDDVSLDIYPGEFVAVMGQSGSGKSTLMNLIGCLDKPSTGTYLVNGRNIQHFSADELATLRRQVFGFIFQRYNLLTNATAAENVEVPGIYAGTPKPQRLKRAADLLASLGLGQRTDHRPSQLSGGQQQRVAIARALMNNPPVILADEPTGALDSRSGVEVMQLLKQLNAEGRTIILITHDASVAAHAQRQITIADGHIQSEKTPPGYAPPTELKIKPTLEGTHANDSDELAEAVKIALRSLKVSLFRTALTLLGIIIGVASVVTMLAVGAGSKQNIVDQISAMGTNLLSIRPGGQGIRTTGDIVTLVPADADAISDLPNVEATVPQRDSRATVRYGNLDYATTISGVGADFPQVRDWAVGSGSFFTPRDLSGYAPVIVLGQTVITNLFPGGENPVGDYVLVGNIPFQVVGTMATKGAGPGGQDQDDVAFVPITTGLVRLFGKSYVSNITVKVTDVKQIDATQAAITTLLKSRHRTEDFSIRNMASILQTVTATQNTLTILLGTVAAISLLVGGIGVMNIMLVSVTERTREIGVRMATGARTKDILRQFITEAAVVCTLGGIIGVVFGLSLALVLKLFGVNVAFTPMPSLLAFSCAFFTGLLFGWWPAKQAAKMDPVVALASE